jgi:creatinine amidohydrolase
MTETEWHNLRAPDLRRLAAADAMVILPVGSTEQHGPHLPVQVDALLAGEVARRTAVKLAAHAPVVVAPTLWMGLAEHHMAFGATITLDFATFHSLLRCVCRSILRDGFRRILILNGHGGNIAALTVLAGELATELEAPVATATYWTLPEATEAFGRILERQPNVRHACEAETSMLLRLKPELVDCEALAGVEAPADLASRGGGLYVWRSFADVTKSGVIGVPEAATAEKGEQLLEAAAEALAKAVIGGELWGLSGVGRGAHEQGDGSPAMDPREPGERHED